MNNTLAILFLASIPIIILVCVCAANRRDAQLGCKYQPDDFRETDLSSPLVVGELSPAASNSARPLSGATGENLTDRNDSVI